MFERFTDRARRVVVQAQEEARSLNHNYIGTEHILLGLIHVDEGTAAKALESLGIGLEAVRQQVEEIVGVGKRAPSGHIPFTPRAKKTLELSLRESLLLGHDYIGTEHILLGLLREGEGVAAQVLVRLGADLNRVRGQVVAVLAEYEGRSEQERERRTLWVRPAGSPAPVGRQQEIFHMLADITRRLKAIEDHLGIRRTAEGGQAGLAATAERAEPEAGQVESGAAGSGEAGPQEPSAGETEPGEAAPGDEPGHGQDPAQG
jgi:ATP-dependent Clp protease ATP-binding subunit ClpA